MSELLAGLVRGAVARTARRMDPGELRRIRLSVLFTQDLMAGLVGVPRATYASWETGRHTPRGARLSELICVCEEIQRQTGT